MNLFRLVLCLTLFVSSLGLAQTSEEEEEEWTPYTPSPPAPSVPPPLVPAEPPAQPAAPDAAEATDEPAAPTPRGEIIPRESVSEDDSPGRALRLVGAPLGAAFGSATGALGGAIVSSLFLMPFCLESIRDPSQGCIVGFVAITSLGAAALGIGSVYAVGNALGGHGRPLPTLLGGLLGMTMGAVSGTVAANNLVLFLGLGIGPIIGAVVGYEISHSLTDAPSAPTARRQTGFELVPVVSATPRGGLMGGLAGRF
jgi:hypothetical protein